ncbi:zinc ribbon domain-containing protein [Clostridium butyricum]|uniref:TcaA protein NTF2-like domain-containing protein n=1 Tax=Clostridium butyricum TaxID=1492 RepID=A0A2S7F7E6_CLOBU|nr:zinc ribbon domain-containing protein [Clostridium butyricum]KHD16188.1 hypothetical protein OA81_05640 [Clostridium butyricum]PPV12983.1 hypothetical protein AWN73_04285 [Clostridium butyricum]
MIKCKKCGYEIQQSAKYCTNCGCANEKINNRMKFKKITIAIITIIILILSVSFTIYKIKGIHKDTKNTIQMINLDSTEFPDIKIEVKSSNDKIHLNSDNITIKENDSYQKNIKVDYLEDRYIITYEASDKKSNNDRNLKICFNENNNENIIDTTYKAPDYKEESKSANVEYSDNTVNTYDKNEIDIRNLMETFMNSSIKSINSKDIYYVKQYVDLNSTILSEFQKTVDSYKEQKITEDLMIFNVENIKKLNEISYEVYTFERYKIYYGAKNEINTSDFKSVYLVKYIDGEFKVNSIKEINKV